MRPHVENDFAVIAFFDPCARKFVACACESRIHAARKRTGFAVWPGEDCQLAFGASVRIVLVEPACAAPLRRFAASSARGCVAL
ncbi:MAG: hypothetical protein ACLRX5_02965 [Slackia sp.]